MMDSNKQLVNVYVKPVAVRAWYAITDVKNRTPLPAELAPFYQRTFYFCMIWVLKLAVYIHLMCFQLFYADASNKPDYVRRYLCRPSLSVRVFMPIVQQFQQPRNRSDSSASKQVALQPLYLHIHGGAFAMADASVDDRFCRSWCNRTGMIVAGLNYSKSPLNPFPTPVHDIAAVARAVIDDSALPIDKPRVVIGGFSAGGNLALTSSLLPELRNQLKAVVVYYPIVDWSHPPPTKWEVRLDTAHKSEIIMQASSILDWAYVTAGQDRKDKLLSPCYARREELPPNVAIIAAQHDMLCREARDMIYSLADRQIPQTGWDEGFEDEHYKWMLIERMKHGFTNDFGETSPRAVRRRKICDEMYGSVHGWLRDRVLSSDGEEVVVKTNKGQLETLSGERKRR